MEKLIIKKNTKQKWGFKYENIYILSLLKN